MNKQPNAFAVYPDSVKMDLSDENELSAIFIHREHANAFSHKMWGEFKTITPIYSQNFDPDFKEEEFTAGQEVEVSDNGEDWAKRFYIGKNKNGAYVAEKDKSVLDYWEYCRPIKEKVTYYVFRDEHNERVTTDKSHADNYEIIHSFTI